MSSRDPSDSPLAIRAIIRGESDLVEVPGGSGGVLGSAAAAEEECAPPKSWGQSPPCVAVLPSSTGTVPLSSGTLPSPAAITEFGCAADSVDTVAELAG